MKFLDKIKLGFYHASYHRNLRCAKKCVETKDLVKFKKYVYRAEDAWKQVVLIQKKYKVKNG
tara:strand:- start:126 stop:311 length:186 start_codon:yes stop_codon:yes gene_type:complete